MASFFNMCHFVYILYSKSRDIFYKGQTNDLVERINRHNMKQEKATQNGVPWTLVWNSKHSSRSAAMILERKLKNLSRKRLITFILKYEDGIVGPDEFLLLEKLSGC
jgi:putative endonuclease